MRAVRVLCAAAGAFALVAGTAPAYADEPTQIRLVEVYEMTPGVSATHQVTLSTDHALIGEQCQSMGTSTHATSAVLEDVDGVTGCRFTWNLEDAGAEVLSVDDGGVFHFESTSARLLEGFSSPEASASIESVTLIAHASSIAEASDGGEITAAGSSTKNDASTAVWRGVTGNVSATGTVDANASSMSPSPTLSPSPSVNSASTQERGHTSTARSLTPIMAITGGVLLIVAITGLVRRSRQSRQAAADAQFARNAALREAQRRSASAEKMAATPYGQRSLPPASSKRHEAPPASAQGSADSNAEMDTERFSPPDLP